MEVVRREARGRARPGRARAADRGSSRGAPISIRDPRPARNDTSLNLVWLGQAYTDMNSKKEEVENLLSHFDSRITETHERVTSASQEAAQVPEPRSIPVDGPPTTLVFINGWVWLWGASFQAGAAY